MITDTPMSRNTWPPTQGPSWSALQHTMSHGLVRNPRSARHISQRSSIHSVPTSLKRCTTVSVARFSLPIRNTSHHWWTSRAVNVSTTECLRIRSLRPSSSTTTSRSPMTSHACLHLYLPIMSTCVAVTISSNPFYSQHQSIKL